MQNENFVGIQRIQFFQGENNPPPKAACAFGTQWTGKICVLAMMLYHASPVVVGLFGIHSQNTFSVSNYLPCQFPWPF